MINRQMTHFFHMFFEFYPLVCFTFGFQELQNSIPSFALCSGLQNTHLHAKDDTFKLVNIDIFFLQQMSLVLV